MTTPEPPEDDLPPDPQDADYIHAMAILRARAERSKADKDQALRDWGQQQSDQEILDEFGLKMDELRKEL